MQVEIIYNLPLVSHSHLEMQIISTSFKALLGKKSYFIYDDTIDVHIQFLAFTTLSQLAAAVDVTIFLPDVAATTTRTRFPIASVAPASIVGITPVSVDASGVTQYVAEEVYSLGVFIEATTTETVLSTPSTTPCKILP